jgi:hypothetical protein
MMALAQSLEADVKCGLIPNLQPIQIYLQKSTRRHFHIGILKRLQQYASGSKLPEAVNVSDLVADFVQTAKGFCAKTPHGILFHYLVWSAKREHPSYWESGPWTGPLDLLMYLSVDRLKCVGLLEEMDHTVDQRCPTMDRVVDLAMDLAIDSLMDLHANIQRYNHFLFWLPSQDASQQQWASSCMVLIGLSSCQFLRLSATTHLALPIKSSAMASSMGGTQAHRGLIVQRSVYLIHQ